MNTLREGMPPLPKEMQDLPVDERGYPVPAFVSWIDGKPEFRAMRGDHWAACVQKKLCWVCGKPLTSVKFNFVAGPMCGINRTSAEPPCHLACAQFSAKACPFMSMPKMRRRENDLPEDRKESGFAIKRNPGVALIWTTKSYKLFMADRGVHLITMGEPVNVEWWCEGREATREEVMESITSGLPFLQDIANKEGPRAVRELERMTQDFITSRLPSR